MRPLENVFSWSMSRARTFGDCPRKYWYHYYGAWGGWEDAAPEEAKELYLLKNITGFHLLAGDVVHRAIEKVLSGLAEGETSQLDEVMAWCKAEFIRCDRDSKDGRWQIRPKQYTRLFEHHYGPPPTREFAMRIARKVGDCVRNFFSSQAFSLIRETDPRDWLPMETLDSFEFEGTKVYAVPDFACRHRGEVLIADWKTGRSDARNRDQVVLYAMFAAARWGVDPDTVRAAPVYLLSGGSFDPKPVTPDDREQFGEKMRASILRMRDRLVDVAENTARKEDYEATAGHVCRSCNFRGVCPHAR